MKYYSYNWATREYIGEDEADPDPKEPGNFIIPAYATFKAPPELEPGQRAFFREDNWVTEIPPPPAADPNFFKQQLAAIPNSLVGDETIGDLFNGQH